MENMRNQTHKDFKLYSARIAGGLRKNKQALQLSAAVLVNQVEKYPNSSVLHSLTVCFYL